MKLLESTWTERSTGIDAVIKGNYKKEENKPNNNTKQ